MARYFPRTPGSLPSPTTHEEEQSGLALEAEMHRLVAERMAASVSRGSSPRGAYKISGTQTKPELWHSTGSKLLKAPIIGETSLLGGIHSNPSPRGAPPTNNSFSEDQNRRQPNGSSDISRTSTRSTNEEKRSKIFENVFGIYAAENKQPPGRSTANELKANIAKAFQFGRKSSTVTLEEKHTISATSSIDLDNEYVEMNSPAFAKLPVVFHKPTRRHSDIMDASSGGFKTRPTSPTRQRQIRSQNRMVPRVKALALKSKLSNESLYANEPLPAIPKLRINDEMPEARTPSPQFTIDIIEWAESTYIFPKNSSQETLAIERFAESSNSPKLPFFEAPPTPRALKCISKVSSQSTMSYSNQDSIFSCDAFCGRTTVSATSECDDTAVVSDTDESFFERCDEWSRGGEARAYTDSYPFNVKGYIYDFQELGDEVSNERQLKRTSTANRHAFMTGETEFDIRFPNYFADRQIKELKVRDLATRIEERGHEIIPSQRRVPRKSSSYPTVYPKSH
ncbi:hypothetical protein BZA77DRAFT_289765 [Pyronema omphalodes]|nr:hypothetical protein BZA77DRAFT_289765 [Pyronema omphalodes]